MKTEEKGVELYSIEGGQRPVTAAPPFWGLAVCDLAGITGPVYMRKVRSAIVDQLILGRFLADPGRLLADIVTMQFRCREF